MSEKINLHNRLVSYTTRRSKRAKRLRLAVYCDGNFIVTLPKGIKKSSAQNYIVNKSQWILNKLDFFKKISTSKAFKLTPDDYLKHKDKALRLVTKRIKHFNKQYGFRYKKITIRNQKTRWSSCSKKKNLNFNFKIAFLPEKLRDYIIVHELCHLRELNHSQKFWNLVAKVIPEYLEINKEVKIFSLKI
ncbi:M48 family metallopeptidase [Patescibacteria group bacterium]|nr:M48 family metallopeptidase [Patescibacteria group bacterium]